MMLKLSHTLLRFALMITLMLSVKAVAQPSSNDEVNLGATIQGNQEQPKVLYVVPWTPPSGPAKFDPLERQGDNVFERVYAPVERIELRRQLHYLKQEGRSPIEK